MDNKLKIKKKTSGNETIIMLEGRLDANWAGHLDDYLNGLVRDGSHRLLVDMAGVGYLSSAGIRTLINQYKKIKKIGGLFVLENLSQPVSDVLQMVGMYNILTEGTTAAVSGEQPESKYLEIDGFQYDHQVLQAEPMKLELTGNPDLTVSSAFTAADNRKIRFQTNQFALGIGAIGDGFDDCKSRYGEFMAIGEALVYKPSDGSKVPDYTIRAGRLEPEINALYSIQATGEFSHRITFDPGEPGRTIPLESLTSAFSQATGLRQFLYVMIAESGGLVGVSLGKPPVDGKQLFEFPGIRENINFTTEPAYSRMQTVTVGFFSMDPDEKLKSFLRPAKPGSPVYLHTHAAVFPYQALSKKEPAANKLVLQLFENSIVEDVLHLLHDTREITGLGESTFKQGVAWIGKIG